MRASSNDELVELELDGVEVAAEIDGLPYLDLREKGGTRRLPIFIGAPEASAIRFALGSGASARPMTHDALQQALQALGGRMERIVIDLVVDASTYTADVTIALPDGTERHLDWRPSDALALAVRTERRPTILVAGAVLDTPPRKLGAVYTLRCACGAAVRFRENELVPSPISQEASGLMVTAPRVASVSRRTWPLPLRHSRRRRATRGWRTLPTLDQGDRPPTAGAAPK